MSKKYLTQELMTEVERLLRANETLRANDKRLVFNVWLKILKQKLEASEFEKVKSVFVLLLRTEIPPIESITRARRKIQEKNPELQKGKKRKQQQEQQVRAEVQGE